MAALLLVLVVQAFRMAYQGNDFTAYLFAAETLWNGQNPYQIQTTLPYLYPLFLATILVPLVFIPYWLAVTLWTALSLGGLVVACAAMLRVAQDACRAPLDRRLAMPALIILLIFFMPILSNTLHGQVNTIVLLCCVMFYCDYTRQRGVRAAAWLAVGIAIKLLPGLLVVFLLVRRQYRIVLWTALFATLCCLLPFAVAGRQTFTLYQGYLDAFVLPSMAAVRTNTPTHFSLPGSIHDLLPAVPGSWLKLVCGLGTAAALFAIEWAAHRAKAAGRDVWPFCAYLVGCLLLSPVVENHHFVMAVPAVWLLGLKTFFDRGWRTPAVIAGIIVFVACFDVVPRWDSTMLSHFAAMGALLALLFLASRAKTPRPEVNPLAARMGVPVQDAHITAHRHSIRHYDEVVESTLCGCFCCCETFPPSEITDWVHDGPAESDQTALCPYCGIDSVIGSASGYPIDRHFLERMKSHWF
jgi:hypothetical protein